MGFFGGGFIFFYLIIGSTEISLGIFIRWFCMSFIPISFKSFVEKNV